MLFQCKTQADYRLIVDALEQASRETLGRDRSVLQSAAREVEGEMVEMFPPVEHHDFRDRGDPMEKVHPDPNHWSRPDRPDDTPKGR